MSDIEYSLEERYAQRVRERDDARQWNVELQAELRQVRAECEQLRGIKPHMPPLPPRGTGLQRYGLRWNGPEQPLATPMDDGYWTPWHLADHKLKAALSQAMTPLPSTTP